MSKSANSSMNTTLDRSGIFVSMLCVVHCLALPLLGTLLPLIGFLAENETVHKVMVLFAIPIVILSTLQHGGRKRFFLYPVFVTMGPLLLLAALLFPFLEEHEVALTVSGALLLSAAHFMNLFIRH